MKRLMWFAMLLCGLILLAGCDIEDLQAMNKVSEDFSYSYPLEDGGSIEVATRNGSVEILGWEKNTVEITGSKYAPSKEELEKVKVEIASTERSLSVKTVFANNKPRNQGARYVIRAPYKAVVTTVDSSNGSIRVEDIAKATRLDTSNGSITVNRSQGPLVADTSNGSIRVVETTGDLRLNTSNGRIEADDVVGLIHADTSNGSIRVTVAEPAAGEPLRFDTSNGSIEVTMKSYEANPMLLDSSNGRITLRIPIDINARLEAETSNGGIQTDIPVTITGEVKKNALRTTLGSGGPTIKLDTSNSTVRILRY